MNVIAEMLLTEPAPAVIWATLMLLTFPALLVLASPAGTRHPRRAAREWLAALRRSRSVRRPADRSRRRDEERRARTDEAVRAARYAEEIRAAADHAAGSAQRWQWMWEQSEDHRNAAWQAWLDADSRVRTALAAAAWGRSSPVRTCEEYAARERYLHRTVAAAADRGELPAAAVADALAGRHGWDARLHPAEQDLVIARASAAWLRQRYEQAVAAERAARHDAERAHRDAGSLRHEARAAAVRAGELSRFLPAPRRTAPAAGYGPEAVPAG
ncbi:hypothetical protein [Actinoplanes auranticolor]|uniref:Uncharacterized protein n=1 Tax=Actinoplanes auranticolor TaxID=47988 RepID=A0A919S998_9ACTN|nr:hypothetical protein [Actinoplanes auranticolor]GIM66674.1 hypothetical protein Aau02nite_23940 [Actinoplanes auranticolor]